MSTSFTADEFARLDNRARRLEEQSNAYEQDAESLLASAETELQITRAALSHETEVTGVSINRLLKALRDQRRRCEHSVATARALCVAAREHHLAIGALIATLRHQAGRTPASGATRRSVLVADDYADTREVVSMVLHEAGFIVRTAGNGIEAIIAAYEMRPAVIVMDVAMPVLDGVEATRLIKAIDTTRETRVIAYTATAPADDLFRNPMFAAVIQKPASPDVVFAAVRTFAAA